MQFATENSFLATGLCKSTKGGHHVLPCAGREGRLATNPISFAVRCNSGDQVLLSDFSTAETSEGSKRVYKNSGKQLPDG